MLVLVALMTVAMALVMSASMSRRATGDEITRTKALRCAEGGVAEAFNRIQDGLGPDPTDANAARQVVQILLASSVGAAGTDTTLLATGQPAGQWLRYSTPNSGREALTIEFLTNPGRTTVLRYDKSLNPPIQATSGPPIYKITSTGTVGVASRRLVVEAIRPDGPNGFDLRGAVVSGTDIKYTGSGVDCGFDHLSTTPYPAGMSGRAGAGGCQAWEGGPVNGPGTFAYGTFDKTGPSLDYGTPPVVSGAIGFYAGPWEVFGMTQSDFFAWVGPHVSAPATPVGVFYVDNDNVPQNRSCNVSYAGAVTGSGLLYVDGNLTFNNNFHFTGLIYCEGKLTATNDAWVLGSVIARGPASGRNDMTGPNTFLFSSAAIRAIPGAPAGAAGKVRALSWKEAP